MKKYIGLAVGYSLGPVALHITAGNVKSAGGTAGKMVQSVQALHLGVAF